MIKPLYLKGENYVTFKEFYLPLGGQGVVRIKGVNKDSARDASGSNGAGKTVLVEALQYILFDTTLRGTKKKDLVGNKNLFIEFAFEKNKDSYLIQKYHSHSVHKNKSFIIKNGEDITPKNSRTDYISKKILEIINISKDEFFNNVFLSPRVSSIFLDGKPKEKIDYISNIFGLDEYEILKEKIKLRMKEAETSIAVAESKLGDFKSLKKKIAKQKPLSSLKKKVKNYTEQSQKVAVMIEKKEKSIRKIDVGLEHAITTDRIKLLSSKSELSYLNISLPKLVDVSRELNQSLASARNKTDKLKTRLADAEQAHTIKAKMGVISVSSKTIKSMKKSHSVLAESIPLVKEYESVSRKLKGIDYKKDLPNLKTVEKDIQKLKSDRAVVESELAQAINELESHQEVESAECPMCYQDVDRKLIKKIIKKLRKRKENSEDIMKVIASRLDALSKTFNLTSKVEPLLKRKKELRSYKDADLASLRGKKKELAKSIEDRRVYLGLRDQLKELGSVTELSDSDVREIPNKVKRLRIKETCLVEKISAVKELASLVDDNPKISLSESGNRKELETKKKKLLVSLSLLREEEKELLELRFKSESKFTKVRDLHQRYAEVDSHTSNLNKITHETKMLKLLSDYCSHARLMKIKELCAVLNESVAEYASVMFTEQDIEFDINYESNGLDFVVRKKEKTYPIKLLSEGERSRLGLCFIFALRDIVSNGKKINLVVLDEIDRHLDPIGKHVFVADLMPKLTSLYSTVLIISHDESIKDSAFDSIFTVTRKNNKSRLRVQ